MLALSRRSGEEIVLTLPNGERIAVKVFRIMYDKVRIAIDAPGDVTIHRGEVQQRIDNGDSFARSGHDGPDDDMDDPA
jgi:carbon storage regulator CsrA